MPIIQLNFFNPLNVSVQVGDVAYYCNPTDVGPSKEWAGTSTPHRTCRQQDIIEIGTIISLEQWNGFNSSITCNMNQIIFNAYGPPRGGECGPFFQSSSNCYDTISIDPQYHVDCDPNEPVFLGGFGTTAPPTNCYYNAGLTATQHMGIFSPIRWFFDDPTRQTLDFRNYIFLNIFTGEYERITRMHMVHAVGHPDPNFYNVADMIQFVIDDLGTSGIATTHCQGQLAGPTQNFYIGMTWAEWTSSCNTGNMPPRFDAYHEVCSDPAPAPPCNGCSFIMFSKDNKVNLNSILGYYASVELRNNSTDEAEIFNVGTRFFESSK
jgi:hypothetical protein